MALLGGLLGAVAGFVIGILLTEVAFTSDASWPDVVPFALAVLGWLVGSSTVRSVRARRTATPH